MIDWNFKRPIGTACPIYSSGLAFHIHNVPDCYLINCTTWFIDLCAEHTRPDRDLNVQVVWKNIMHGTVNKHISCHVHPAFISTQLAYVKHSSSAQSRTLSIPLLYIALSPSSSSRDWCNVLHCTNVWFSSLQSRRNVFLVAQTHLRLYVFSSLQYNTRSL